MDTLKHRIEPVELRLMRSLNTRMKLPSKDKKNYLNKEKGYQGELMFDEWTAKLSNNFIILNDVLLENNNSQFQTDSFLLSQETLYQFEVKNYEGDFYYDAAKKRWCTFEQSEIKNPLLQLERSESLMRQLIHDFGYNYSITPLVIFVNLNFQLYLAPMNQPIIYPAQLQRFMTKLESIPSTLNEKHFRFAKLLNSLHINESPYKRLPVYTYERIAKGITCADYYSFFSDVDPILGVDKLICKKCGCVEDTESAILRTVEEFTLLFPDLRITTCSVFEWCKIIKSKKTIRKALIRKLILMNHGHSSYYVLKK